MTAAALRPMIESSAMAAGLAPNLVEAFVLKESGGQAWAWNPEPGYRYLWNVRTNRPFRTLTLAERAAAVPPADFPSLAGDRDQEWTAQRASWGLLQIMGGLARELGFAGAYLPQLLDPELNLSLGCSQIARLLAWAQGDERRAAAAYNAGRGGVDTPRAQQYARAVLMLRHSVDAVHPSFVKGQSA